jgi:hypothetical protein
VKRTNGTLILAGLVLAAFAQVAPGDTAEPRPRTTLRAVVLGLTSGGTCVLRLAPNGIVQGVCGLSPAFADVRRWRRDGDCVCLLNGDRRVVLAFRATSGGVFRAEDVEPEALELRLMAATSVPLTE